MDSHLHGMDLQDNRSVNILKVIVSISEKYTFYLRYNLMYWKHIIKENRIGIKWSPIDESNISDNIMNVKNFKY